MQAVATYQYDKAELNSRKQRVHMQALLSTQFCNFRALGGFIACFYSPF